MGLTLKVSNGRLHSTLLAKRLQFPFVVLEYEVVFVRNKLNPVPAIS